jgi:ribosomal protein S18 acetylase RimI-like enzyme
MFAWRGRTLSLHALTFRRAADDKALRSSSSMAERVDISRLTIVRLPSKKLPFSYRLLQAIKHTEKRTFPTNEAFDFDAELKKRSTALYCVYRDDDGDAELCGYAVYVRSKLVTRIHKVCVVERYRGQGVGRWMMGQVIRELQKAAAGNVDLWVDTERAPARRLYRTCGFAEMETVRDYYSKGRDAIRMQVDLETRRGS